MLVVAAGGDLAGVHVRHQALQHPGHPAPQPAGARAAAAPRPSPPGRGGQGHATMLAALRCAPRPRGRAGPGRAAALPPPPAGRALRRRAPPGRHLTPVTWRGARHLATANGAPGRAVSPRLRGARAREAAGSRPARGHGLPRDRDRDRYWFRYRDLPRPRRTAHSAAPLRRRGPTGRSDPRRRALGAAARPGPAAPAALCPVCALARPATAGKGSRRPAPPPAPPESDIPARAPPGEGAAVGGLSRVSRPRAIGHVGGALPPAALRASAAAPSSETSATLHAEGRRSVWYTRTCILRSRCRRRPRDVPATRQPVTARCCGPGTTAGAAVPGTAERPPISLPRPCRLAAAPRTTPAVGGGCRAGAAALPSAALCRGKRRGAAATGVAAVGCRAGRAGAVASRNGVSRGRGF